MMDGYRIIAGLDASLSVSRLLLALAWHTWRLLRWEACLDKLPARPPLGLYVSLYALLMGVRLVSNAGFPALWVCFAGGVVWFSRSRGVALGTILLILFYHAGVVLLGFLPAALADSFKSLLGVWVLLSGAVLGYQSFDNEC